MEDTDMKKTYIKPEQRVVLLQHKTMLLAGSVINPGVPNAPAGLSGFCATRGAGDLLPVVPVDAAAGHGSLRRVHHFLHISIVLDYLYVAKIQKKSRFAQETG